MKLTNKDNSKILQEYHLKKKIVDLLIFLSLVMLLILQNLEFYFWS